MSYGALQERLLRERQFAAVLGSESRRLRSLGLRAGPDLENVRPYFYFFCEMAEFSTLETDIAGFKSL